MNKYLMLSAAAVLAGATNANARTHSFTFGTGGGGSYCDGGVVDTARDGGKYSGAIWSWQHTNVDCNGRVSNGQGIVGKTKGFGKIADMSENYGLNVSGSFFPLNYTLPKRLNAGQPWTLWLGIFGTTSFEVNSGILINTKPGLKGTHSTLESVMSLIRAHRHAVNKD